MLCLHFRLPVQVNLKAEDLQKELLRALSVSRLFFSLKGNSSIMKVRLSKTLSCSMKKLAVKLEKVSYYRKKI